jgi:hypothetical protein
MDSFIIEVATSKHLCYAEEICKLIEISAKERGTGIAKRSPEYIMTKMQEGKAIIAIANTETLAGFCYIESWGEKQYAANSGLIVNPIFRGVGLSRKIKEKAFRHSRKLFPKAKLFGLTTSLPVMKINSELGYVPVTYNQLTSDELFWNGCQSCVNFEILKSKERRHCMCTAMLFDPEKPKKNGWNFMKKSKVYTRFMELKKKRLSQLLALFL